MSQHLPLLLEKSKPFVVLLLMKFLRQSVGNHFLFILFLRALLDLLFIVFHIVLRFCLLILTFSGVGDGIILYFRQSLRFLSCCQGLTLFIPRRSKYCGHFLLCNRIALFVNFNAFA